MTPFSLHPPVPMCCVLPFPLSLSLFPTSPPSIPHPHVPRLRSAQGDSSEEELSEEESDVCGNGNGNGYAAPSHAPSAQTGVGKEGQALERGVEGPEDQKKSDKTQKSSLQ
jgi:hypothetical protein